VHKNLLRAIIVPYQQHVVDGNVAGVVDLGIVGEVVHIQSAHHHRLLLIDPTFHLWEGIGEAAIFQEKLFETDDVRQVLHEIFGIGAPINHVRGRGALEFEIGELTHASQHWNEILHVFFTLPGEDILQPVAEAGGATHAVG